MNEELFLALRQGLGESGLSMRQLYLAYLALGGTGTAVEVAAFIDGTPILDVRDFNILAQAINERFIELGTDQRVPYTETEPPTIHYLDVVPMLISATPSFEMSVDAARVEVGDGEYLHITQFVRHLIRLLCAGETGGFDRTFETVERVLAEGEEQAIQLMWFGFFDDLLQPDLYESIDRQPADFGPWLGPLARRFPPIAAALRDR
jgi:hypothetical protein